MAVILRDINTTAGQDGRKETLEGEDAVQNMLMNLFNTTVGEERFQEDYGVDFEYYLQDEVSTRKASSLRSGMVKAAQAEVPQLVVDEAKTTVTANYDLPGYDVVFVYSCNLTNTTGVLSFSISR